MTFQEAEAEIRLLLPEAHLINLYYKKAIWHNQFNRGLDVECSVNWCPPGYVGALRADAETWQGVIDKIKIIIMPKGTLSSEEEPDAIGAVPK